MKYLYFWILFSLAPLVCKSQFSYKKITSGQLLIENPKQIDTIGFIDLTSLLPKNYVKDGSLDYTSYIQNGLNKYKNVLFPDFPLLINAKGLTFRSNSRIYFKSNSILLMQPNKESRYQTVRLHNVKNVYIYNIKIKGDKKRHKGSVGEWGMGISILSSQNIHISNSYISECWGDGIYIGQIGNQPSRNVFIENAFLDDNRRNGISITSVIGLEMNNCLVSNSFGTYPMSGVCIEPNSNNDFIDNIKLKNIHTYNNAESGIVIGLGKLPGISPKRVNIDITNHTDEHSSIGFHYGRFKKSYINASKLSGRINIVDPVWNNTMTPFKSGDIYNYSSEVSIKNPRVNNKNYKQAIKEQTKMQSKFIVN